MKTTTTVNRRVKLAYRIFTILFAFLMTGSAIPDIISSPVAVKGMHQDLGYPLYFIPFIGIAKMLGVLAILLPGFKRIKEWAYAGLAFDLFGATYSIIVVNTTPGNVLFMLVPITIGILSYTFYRRNTILMSITH